MFARGAAQGDEIAYRFDSDDHDVVDALRRIAAEQIGRAIGSAERDGDLAPRVHDIRKRIKKVRGLIRLVRPVFPDYARENEYLRDTARALSGPRDAQVMVQTLDALLERHEGPIDPDAFETFRADLAGPEPEAVDLAPTVETLQRARQRIEVWTLSDTGWDAIEGGLRKTYRRARKGQDGKTDEEIHEWRKPIKYHWYHARLLRDIWPEAMDARIEVADRMGELLGLYQDLSVLGDRVKGCDLPKPSRRVLRGLIKQRQAEVLAEAHEIAPRILAEKPKALTARLGECWAAWRG